MGNGANPAPQCLSLPPAARLGSAGAARGDSAGQMKVFSAEETLAALPTPSLFPTHPASLFPLTATRKDTTSQNSHQSWLPWGTRNGFPVGFNFQSVLVKSSESFPCAREPGAEPWIGVVPMATPPVLRDLLFLASVSPTAELSAHTAALGTEPFWSLMSAKEKHHRELCGN